MAFNYTTNLNSVVNALKDYNTTLSSPDLSGSLNTRVDNQNIFASDPMKYPPRVDRLPSIYVLIDNKEEDYTTLGQTGNNNAVKEAIVTYNIVAVLGKRGGWEEHEDLLTESYQFASNIEAVFQKEYDLSNTALWCNPQTTEFINAIELGDGFAKAVGIKLIAHYHFR